MSVADLLLALRREVRSRAYIVRLDVLDQSATMLKARLYVSADRHFQFVDSLTTENWLA